MFCQADTETHAAAAAYIMFLQLLSDLGCVALGRAVVCCAAGHVV
jgi:hypothetical protein